MNSTTTTDEEARMQFEDRERARAERNVEHEEPAPEPAASQGGAQSPCRDAPEPAASPGVAQSPCRNEHRDKFPGTKCAGCSSRWVMKKVCPHHPDLVWCSNCHNNHAKVCNDNGIARMSHLPQESWVPGKACVVCERRQDDAQPYSNRSLCPDCRLHYCSQCYEAHIDRCVPGSWRLKSAASQDSARQPAMAAAHPAAAAATAATATNRSAATAPQQKAMAATAARPKAIAATAAQPKAKPRHNRKQ